MMQIEYTKATQIHTQVIQPIMLVELEQLEHYIWQLKVFERILFQAPERTADNTYPYSEIILRFNN